MDQRPSQPSPLLLLLLASNLVTACASPDLDTPTSQRLPQPVVGGVAASPEDYPSTVAVTNTSGKPFCSGTLVAPSIVVTAAHCILSKSPSSMRVVYGFTTPESAPEEERRTIAQSLPHPKYSPNATTDAYGLGPLHDIGVLVLDAPIPHAVIAPVLPEEEVDAVLYPNRPLHIVGYGIYDKLTQDSGVLYKALTPHVRHIETELLAGRPGQPDTCFGDSGGPAYVVDQETLWLVGATSRAWEHAVEPCGHATVYTIVPPYVKWISAIAGELDGGVIDGGFTGGGWDAAQQGDASLLSGDPACVPLDNVCHPVTNEGCDTLAGEACRFDPITAAVGCHAGPNQVAPASICDQTSRFCMPGYFCGASIRCEKLCCNDADCPVGVNCTPLISLLGNIGTCGPVKIDAEAPDAQLDAQLDAFSDANVDTAWDASLPDAEAKEDAPASTQPDGSPDAPDSKGERPIDNDDPGPPDAINPGCACTVGIRQEGSKEAFWLLVSLGLISLGWKRRSTSL